MSERPIPDDLMAIARALRTGVVWESNASVDLISRTLLEVRSEERERCAKLCEGDFDSEMRAYGNAFAEMIRGGQ